MPKAFHVRGVCVKINKSWFLNRLKSLECKVFCKYMVMLLLTDIALVHRINSVLRKCLVRLSLDRMNRLQELYTSTARAAAIHPSIHPFVNTHEIFITCQELC